MSSATRAAVRRLAHADVFGAFRRFLCIEARLGENMPNKAIAPDRYQSLANDNKIRVVSYADLRHWLADCRKECWADKVRWFIQDFTIRLLRI